MLIQILVVHIGKKVSSLIDKTTMDHNKKIGHDDTCLFPSRQVNLNPTKMKEKRNKNNSENKIMKKTYSSIKNKKCGCHTYKPQNT